MSYAGGVLVIWTNTPGKVPTPDEMAQPGRIGVNQADGILFTRRPDGTVRAHPVQDPFDLVAVGPIADALEARQLASPVLDALGELPLTANRIPYATGPNTFGLAPLTAFARSILDDSDAITVRATLGLGTAATGALADFAAASHSHAVADVLGLQAALNGKAASSHAHPIADVTDLQPGLDARPTTAAMTTAISAAVANAGVAPGCVSFFATVGAPTGWLKANGAAVSRSAYGGLFSAIGTTYGAGDGSTTFTLPDFRGYFLRALDEARGVDGGRTFGSVQAESFKAHDHYDLFYGGVRWGVSTSSGASGSAQPVWAFNGGQPMSTGVSGGAETRPKNIAIPVCIKY